MPNTANQVKPPKTYKEQLEILKSRGLHVDCDAAAVHTLSSVNYYRLRGYYCHLQQQDQFNSNTSFTHLEMLHRFDSELRTLLYPLLYEIEITARTRIAYCLAHSWGAMGYQNVNHYFVDGMNEVKKQTITHQHSVFMERLNDTIDKSKSIFIKHHEKKYGKQIPVWVAVEALTFGSLSKLYSILPMQRQKEIAKTYGELDHELFENWLHMCVDLRNICAHYDRIYCFRFVKGIKVEKHIEKQIKQASNNNFRLCPNRLFAYLLAIRRLSDSGTWNAFYAALDALFQRYQPFMQEIHLGFPYQWKCFLAQKSS